MRPVHLPWAAIYAIFFAARPAGGTDAIAANPSPALRGETVTLKWYFAASKIVVSGGRFGSGTVVTGRTSLTDKPLRTTRYVFDVWYPSEQSPQKPAGQDAKPVEPLPKAAEPTPKPTEPAAKPPAPAPSQPGSTPSPQPPAPTTPATGPAPLKPVDGQAPPTQPAAPAPTPSAQTAPKPAEPQSKPPQSAAAPATGPAAPSAGQELVHVQYPVVVHVIDPQTLGLVPYLDFRGWRVHFLKGWERDNVALPAPADNALMYFQPEEDSPERLAVAVLPVNDVSSEDIMRKVQADMPSYYDDFQVVSQSNLTHESVPAVVATCTGKDKDGQKLETYVMALVKDGHAYVVSARTEAARFAARKGLLTDMVHSFRFVAAPAARGSNPVAPGPAKGQSTERP